MDEVVSDADVERSFDERDELDSGQPLAELEHQRARQADGLILVAALRAVRDPHLDRGHAAAGDRSTISRSARTTSRLAQPTSASRRCMIWAVSRARTSSESASGDDP